MGGKSGSETLNMNIALVLHQTLFGAIAAAGFGVLFNVAYRLLPWCAVTGALALAARTLGMQLGWSLVGSSFAGALVVGLAVQLMRMRTEVSLEVFGVAGCIPMVPGSIAAKAILGLFAFSTGLASNSQPFMTSVQYALRVMFTMGAIGTGLAIPTLFARLRLSQQNQEDA